MTLLNVDRSLLLSRWVLPAVDEAQVAQMVQAHGVPDMVARMLSARGVGVAGFQSFLQPTLAQDFPDPLRLKGMRDAAAELTASILAGRKFALFADFDVDGATSTAILVRFFRYLGIDMPFHIPDRLSEGYGPNIPALKKLQEQGAEIVILADCGTTAFDVVEQARGMGLDIVILDHHEAEDKLPIANHIINPKRKDDESGYDMLAACGVSFLLCVALNTSLRDAGYFGDRPPAPMKSWMDILALGTVCDMVPLTGPNRLFVKYGLEQMVETENPGLRALMDVAGVKGAPDPYTCGFMLGPRINAGGRIHKADLGATLLSTDDAEAAKNIAWTLNDCNDKRKDMQADMMDQAMRMVVDRGLDQHPAILVGDESWHPGLNGLVAGRLVEKYKRPAAVIAYTPGHDHALEGRGSGRSVPGINIASAFIDARNRDLLIKGGGHAMAAGFTILPERVEPFRDFFLDHIARQAAGQVEVSETAVDGVLSVRGATLDLVKTLQQVGPFGQANPEPLFILPHVRVQSVDIVGADHVRLQIGDSDGGGRMKAMAFRAAENPVGQALLSARGGNVHLLGRLKINEWQGRESVELHVEDAAPA